MPTTETIGTTGGRDYATIALWATAVKAVGGGTLDDDYIGEYSVNEAGTYGASTDLDFSAVNLNGFTITLKAADAVKHDGSIGSGARIESTASFGGMYDPRQVIIEDMEFTNTEATNGGARVFNSSSAGTSCTVRRCLIKATSTGSNSVALNVLHGTYEACFITADQDAVLLTNTSDVDMSNCTVLDATNGFNDSGNNHTGTIRNCVAYNCTTDWSGTFGSGTYTNNASLDNTHPGTSGVDLTGDPFEIDGYTPTGGGELHAAGVDLSIILDAANNTFNATPSIGAYEGPALTGISNVFFLPEAIPTLWDWVAYDGLTIPPDSILYHDDGKNEGLDKIHDAQTDTDYDNSPTTEGTFAAGTGYSVSDVITVTGGATVTVDTLSGSAVATFTVDSTTDLGGHTDTDVLSQVSVAPTGGTGFSLTVERDNIRKGTGADDTSVNAAFLTDSVAAWTIDEWIGYEVVNTTQGGIAPVTDSTATTVVGTLDTGDWDSGDTYLFQHPTILTDLTQAWQTNEWVNFKIRNTSDGSEGIITANTATTVTVASLTGGTNNAWRSGNNYEIVVNIDTGDQLVWETLSNT